MKKKYCKTCGELGDCDGYCDECANCWEVEKRLRSYLKSRKGIEFVLKMLENMELSDGKYHITILKVRKQ